MKREVVIATKNAGKVKDFQQLFAPLDWEVRSLLDFPEIPEIIEDGHSFRENAAKKAEAIAAAFGKTVLADDSGLVVDALDGRPGIYSARYAGPDKDDQANNEKVLAELQGVPQEERTARFVCVIAVASPNKVTRYYEGFCEGEIALRPSGENGFGYDPIFYVPELKKTMAELSPQEKNRVSHRAEAMKQLTANQSDWE